MLLSNVFVEVPPVHERLSTTLEWTWVVLDKTLVLFPDMFIESTTSLELFNTMIAVEDADLIHRLSLFM